MLKPFNCLLPLIPQHFPCFCYSCVCSLLLKVAKLHYPCIFRLVSLAIHTPYDLGIKNNKYGRNYVQVMGQTPSTHAVFDDFAFNVDLKHLGNVENIKSQDIKALFLDSLIWSGLGQSMLEIH